MTVITTRITVTADGAVSVAAPLPAGQHMASIEIADLPASPAPLDAFDIDKLPVFDMGPWPATLSLRREDLCGDDGLWHSPHPYVQHR